jgi:membrane protease YdiL (CAAX protease family)
MTAPAPRELNPAREAFLLWLSVFVALAVLKFVLGFIPYGGSITGAIAVGLFLWSPTEVNRRVGRDEDDGLTLAYWKQDVLFAVAVMAVVFPLFVLGFRGFLLLSDRVLPPAIASWLTPYGGTGHFAWRWPPDPVNLVGGNIAVALAEEFFYRGYMLRRFSERWPPRTRVLGAPFGVAMLLQTALFALGHLLTPAVYRLATFFPGLLFGWMAARSKRVVAPAIVHASSNILIATLEASAFGG